ncbi:UDP-N-acetylmuramate dehydrogenase [bacterium]|nr:UDP-N-acetylmuramate dehydrogenase [bacterium]
MTRGIIMHATDSLKKALSQAAQNPVYTNYPMSKVCSYRMGGPAKYFCAPANTEAFRACLLLCHQHQIPYIVLGSGANLLFRDTGFQGVVLSTKKINYFTSSNKGDVRVGAGLPVAALTEQTLACALADFEWASGLPGTIGGGVFMNAKCYGHSFSDIVEEVQTLTPSGEERTFSQPECRFAYKNSIFQHNQHIIMNIRLKLVPGTLYAIQQKTEEILKDRKNKGQFLFPSAGCVYKNDYNVGTPSGTLIETCGLKGHQIGGIRVSEQHANFLVNTGKGCTQDLLDLMQVIEAKVWEKHHVRLQPEIHIVP